jgi:hypothetical protein
MNIESKNIDMGIEDGTNFVMLFYNLINGMMIKINLNYKLDNK